jgi:hypothetical protein
MCSFVADARIAFPCAVGAILKPAGDANRDLDERGSSPMGHRFSCRVKSCWSSTDRLDDADRMPPPFGVNRLPREASHARNTRLASKQGRAYTPAKSSAR